MPKPDKIEVVGLGQASMDYLGMMSSFPEEDQKVELLDLVYQCGGPASTALVTLSRLGLQTSFLGSISDDLCGKEILKGLKDEGVDTSRLKILPGYTSQFAFIAISSANANRTIFWHRGSVPPLSAVDIDLSPFPGAKILHVDGLMIEASVEAARQARRMGMKVVMDAGTMREGSLDLARLVDTLIASERFAEPLVGPGAATKQALEALRSLGPREVVITLGSRGSMGWEDGRVIFQDAFPVEAVDTTGAGDVYHGAYIYGLIQNWGMAEKMRLASAAAALKCLHVGARKGIPGLKEILSFMKNP
ncbi:MAG: sugar kinase [Deltaproteobacteria bacterium]|nr:sugar kinase [Deltaproteobacteria bacterium]